LAALLIETITSIRLNIAIKEAKSLPRRSLKVYNRRLEYFVWCHSEDWFRNLLKVGYLLALRGVLAIYNLNIAITY